MLPFTLIKHSRRCGKPPRPSGSKGRPPQINNVLTVADKKKMTPMESNVAAVDSLKLKVEEDNKNSDADDFVHNSTAQTTQTND